VELGKHSYIRLKVTRSKGVYIRIKLGKFTRNVKIWHCCFLLFNYFGNCKAQEKIAFSIKLVVLVYVKFFSVTNI
jgi:hypothetical protein